MRNREPRPGQVGKYWLSKKPGRAEVNDPWCRTWYESRQTRRISLGTANIHEASLILADWVAQNQRAIKGRPEDVLIDTILLAYWEERGKNLASATTQKYNLRKWHEFWDERTVAEITPSEQRRFRAYLGEGTKAPSTIDRVLSAGRAALNWAAQEHELTVVPRIALIETEQDKQSRPEMGRPVTIPEMARMFDVVRQKHVFAFMMILANTLARSEAIYDLRRKQFDSEHGLLALNPSGRRQTKKYRPIVPVTNALRPWLEAETDQEAFYTAYRGEKIRSIRSAWNQLRADTGIPDLTAYSFRHGVAREMRKRKVPLEEIKLFLGHRPLGSDKTTSIYAPLDPDYCGRARDAIDEIMLEVRNLRKRGNFDDPNQLDEEPKSRTGGNGHLSKQQRDRMIELIDNEVKAPAIAKELGVSLTAVYKARKRAASKR